MKKFNIKKTIIGIIAIGVICFSTTQITSAFGGNTGLTSNLWKLVNGTIKPVGDNPVEIDTLQISGEINPGPLILATSTSPELRFANDTDTGIGWEANDELGFYTGGVERLTINSDGNVILQNNTWLAGRNNADTNDINMFKINTSDEIEVGGTLISGSFEFTEDSGMTTLVDMPVSATPVAGTEEGYYFKIDGNNIFSIQSQANSAGGIGGELVLFNGGIRQKRTASAVSYNPSALTSDNIIAITNTSVARTCIISTEDVQSGSTTNPRLFVCKDESGLAGTNNITVSLESGNIDGGATKVISGNYDSLSFYVDGTNAFTY